MKRQSYIESTTNIASKKIQKPNIPVRRTSLILAGIRADELDHLTFPWTLHSGNEGWLARIDQNL